MINEAIYNKYAEALRLYAETDLSQKEICEQCNVKLSSFRAYLHRNCRAALFKRYKLNEDKVNVEKTKLHGRTGQSITTKLKYKSAIKACSDSNQLSKTISQIAKEHGLNGTALANQLRMHYPDIFEGRENERRLKGLTDNKQRGVRQESLKLYAEAVELLRTTDLTIKEVALRTQVSFTGLRQHIQFYHKDIMKQRLIKRERIAKKKKAERKLNQTKVAGARKDTMEKYAEALKLYQTTDLIVKDIAQKAHVPFGGFCNYLRVWHRDLMLQRRTSSENVHTHSNDLSQVKRYLKSTAKKYEGAIDRLKATKLPTATVAAEFGLNPENFRSYLWEHEPELAKERGMITTEDGKKISQLSYEKYRKAIALYETTDASLKRIALHLGLVYNSLVGFIHRNCPEAIEKHKALSKKS